MSLKTLEMQIALPRSVDWGMMMERMNQHPYLVQERAASLRQKREERFRKTAEKTSSASYQTLSHPYKGQHLDRSI
ncbi:hypothetical protein CULT_740017 [[Clostridium] ultunense Esp]|uniref:hypothetical protein n=1 Tax=Thermicanus aegyptius TaxID=94009 RepID=UPI0002B7027B|nr:hypothetical protein [Thermicanus aegyptius]CCQ97931.1 hypothetical protein CULT_740017 [[Clostridium] ultunense Esp]